jgi:hypothetical protein
MKLQKKSIIEGDLVVGWLSLFDIRARLSKRRRRKVFVIGLPKSATTSVHYALHKAGLKSEHFPFRLVNYEDGDLVFNNKDLENHDAVSDLPVAASLEKLVELYPDALFIYTKRDKQKWLDSCRRHPWPIELILHANLVTKISRISIFNGLRRALMNNVYKLKMLHEKVLGASVFVPEVFERYYDAYDSRVKRLFDGRSNLVEINIADGVHSKERLGNALGIPLEGPFEHKDCFYTWFFKRLAKTVGWNRILRIRQRYRGIHLSDENPPPLQALPS